MSRSYEMRVTVKAYTRKHAGAIVAALNGEWEFDPGILPPKGRPLPPQLEAVGTSCLCGGESEEEFAERITHAVWTANRGYCEIEILATYLDVDPPSTIHALTEDDYREWRAKAT